MDLPLGLKTILESGECVLFIGAGIGKHLLDPNDSPAPDGSTLTEELIDHFDIDPGDTFDLSKIAAIVELRRGRIELEAFLRKRLANLEPDDTLKWIFSRRWKAIFTTNYDYGIERAYELIGKPKQKAISISSTSDLVSFDPRFEVPIYHLHGTLFGSEKPHIIITEDDYALFKESRRMLFELLKTEFATSSILYIGYSNKDPNWKTLYNELMAEFLPSLPPHSYRIAPKTDFLERELLESKGIETIDITLHELVSRASVVISDKNDSQDRFQRLKSSIPSDLLEAFEKNPAGVARLLSSWTYVNQAAFNQAPNLDAFLTGDRPNWGLIGSRLFFERDIDDDIYNHLLDYITGNSTQPSISILLGSAGYGVSTLLMALAARLVKENAGPIFILKPEERLLEGDIDFATQIFDEKPIFFIDNASESSESIYSASITLKNRGKSAGFVLGERLNEWRQSHGKVFGKEFILEALSDIEINKLLDYLSQNSRLNVLEPLSREMQFAVIKEKHKRDLLVVLRESTEGKIFDAILEDEYRGIANEKARKLYLIVCCFYQHGAYIRDQLLEPLLDTSLTDIYDTTGDATEGVVIFEPVNNKDGQYVARARHRIIAAVVWERCGDPGERERILQISLSSLNLNYGLDKDAFEHFIMSDRIVDSIRSLEGKIKFFEKACQKDPLSPYVRQHYARMLLRENKTELALSQIDEAIKLDSKVRVLYHTKGMILSHMAINSESSDLGRRRLTQAEDNFRHGLSLYSRDEYCYQGLAQLYFDWANRCLDSEEIACYISKAEETINEGLKKVQVKDGLWIISSNIQSWLGNQPSHIAALERAVKESPGSIVARYLLARAYRKMGEPQKAIDVLTPIINSYHEEYRSFVEYAVSLMMVSKSYQQGIAVLQLSTLYGYSDPRFIATLGGMLYMEGKFTDALKVFNESGKHDFSSKDLNTIQFIPINFENENEPLRLIGQVSVVKAGHSIIEVPGFPLILCPGSKYYGTVLIPRMRVSFEIVFTAKGAIADKPKMINNT